MNKKLAAAISVAAAAVGTSVALCPSAVADTDCPYDMSTAAGQQALTDATVAASNQVRSDEASMGPSGDQAVADKDLQIQADNTRVILACSGKASPESSQALANTDQAVANGEAARKQQDADMAALNAPPPPAIDLGDPHQASNNGGCQKQHDFYSSLLPVKVGDSSFSALQLIPGVSQGEAITELACGVGDIPNTLMNPSTDNQSDLFSGACNGFVDMSKYPVGEPCGNTPAG
jgi:hypothetical protein